MRISPTQPAEKRHRRKDDGIYVTVY